MSSPFVTMKRLEADVLRMLAFVDVADLDVKQQQDLNRLKRGLIDARLEVQDYELAETRDDQQRNAKQAKKYLQTVEKLVVSNPAQIFGAVDIAHLSAYIGQIEGKLV